PLFGGVMAHFLQYRPIFFATAAFSLAGGAVVIRYVREDFVRPDRQDRSGVRDHLLTIFRSPELRSMLVLVILVQSSIVIVAPFLSLYVEFLKVPPDYLGLATGAVFGVTGIANASTAPFWGKKADRVGSDRVLRQSLLGLTLFSLPQALVTNVFQLFALRAGLGVFLSGFMPIINTIIRRATPEKDRGGIYGIFQSGLLLGNVVGPLAGGALAASLGLRSIFLITTAVFFAAFAWHRRVMAARTCGPR
ncbi:MAG TPA: MFS transporter, partial [Thermodesulfobacteriota bacterium]|nr:MFS transporter [Thermodesulfobacteriota bacterium]